MGVQDLVARKQDARVGRVFIELEDNFGFKLEVARLAVNVRDVHAAPRHVACT